MEHLADWINFLLLDQNKINFATMSFVHSYNNKGFQKDYVSDSMCVVIFKVIRCSSLMAKKHEISEMKRVKVDSLSVL